MGDQQDNEDDHGNGEDDFLQFKNRMQLGHLDLTHLLNGQ